RAGGLPRASPLSTTRQLAPFAAHEPAPTVRPLPTGEDPTLTAARSLSLRQRLPGSSAELAPVARSLARVCLECPDPSGLGMACSGGRQSCALCRASP